MKFDWECDVCIRAMHVVWMDISPHSSEYQIVVHWLKSLNDLIDKHIKLTQVIFFFVKEKKKNEEKTWRICVSFFLVPCAIYVINANIKSIKKQIQTKCSIFDGISSIRYTIFIG